MLTNVKILQYPWIIASWSFSKLWKSNKFAIRGFANFNSDEYQVSISSTFYAQPFCMKVFFECRWNCLGVNFVNIFTYKFFVQTSFRQLFLIKFWLWWKIRTKNARVKRWWNRRQDYKRQPKESHISVVFGRIPKERFSICFILFEKAKMMFLWSTRSITYNF